MENIKVKVITCTENSDEDINSFIKGRDIWKIKITEGTFDTIYIFYKIKAKPTKERKK